MQFGKFQCVPKFIIELRKFQYTETRKFPECSGINRIEIFISKIYSNSSRLIEYLVNIKILTRIEEKLEYLVSGEEVEYRRMAWLTVVAMETLKTRHHWKKKTKQN